MIHSKFPFSSQADLPGVAFSAMRQMILKQAKSSDLTVLEDSETALSIQTAHGVIGLRAGEKSQVAGLVAAHDAQWLFMMKAAVVDQMRQALPEVAAAMRWSNGPSEGSLPPNFIFVRVKDVAQLGPNFLRVTLEGEDLSRFGDDAIHFRLVQPPVDAAPTWPSVGANGSLKWPDGPGAPHKPVYTVRAIDHGANTLITDIFIHDGGRTTAWAQEILDGKSHRKVVGMVGPSGGGLLESDRVLMATDETGFPAAARILDALPSDATGEVFLEAEHGAKCAYPIQAPSAVRVTWLARAQGDCLTDQTLAVLPDHAQSKIWFAGERDAARRVREAAKAAGRDAGDLRISGFWNNGLTEAAPSK